MDFIQSVLFVDALKRHHLWCLQYVTLLLMFKQLKWHEKIIRYCIIRSSSNHTDYTECWAAKILMKGSDDFDKLQRLFQYFQILH